MKCNHSKALPAETCSFCNNVSPETLTDICCEFILSRLETICEFEPCSDNLKLRSGVALPVEICERLLNIRLSRNPKINNFINIFKDRQFTRLKRVKLLNTDVKDRSLQILLQHDLVELEISRSPDLSIESLKNLTEHANNLILLSVIDCPYILPSNLYYHYSNRDHIIMAPQMRKLCLRNFDSIQPEVYELFLRPLKNLIYLDLSNCNNLANLCFVKHLYNLTSLILYNIDGIDRMIPAICTLKNLRHLDISQSRDDRGKYDKPNQLLATVVENLPKLVSLDISGTNLAGRGVAEISPNKELGPCASDIPGLSSRVNNPFQFLGLYETLHDACLRHDIPAKLVSQCNFFFLLMLFI